MSAAECNHVSKNSPRESNLRQTAMNWQLQPEISALSSVRAKRRSVMFLDLRHKQDMESWKAFILLISM